jgi:nucleotide-binding universal stress UspA family protein
MLSRILVPLDGSPEMARVIPALRQLVGGSGAVAYLLLVRPRVHRVKQDAGGPSIPLHEVLEQEAAAWRDYLAQVGAPLAYDGVVIRREVRFGNLVQEILDAACRHAVQLIVVMAQSQGGLGRLLQPSRAHQLLAHANVPVLAVPVRALRFG